MSGEAAVHSDAWSTPGSRPVAVIGRMVLRKASEDRLPIVAPFVPGCLIMPTESRAFLQPPGSSVSKRCRRFG